VDSRRVNLKGRRFRAGLSVCGWVVRVIDPGFLPGSAYLDCREKWEEISSDLSSQLFRILDIGSKRKEGETLLSTCDEWCACNSSFFTDSVTATRCIGFSFRFPAITLTTLR
jgi:hypothetical protein